MQNLPTIVSTLISLLAVIGWWKLFSKANIAGWKALIPFYNDYIRFKIAGKVKMYVPYLVLSLIKAVLSVVSIVVFTGNLIELFAAGTFDGTGIEMKLISWGLTFVLLFFEIYRGRYIAFNFGKSGLFGVGIGLLPIVFVTILAFGKSEYQIKEYI